MNEGKRNQTKIETTPGPGAYQYQPQASGGVSLSGRPKSTVTSHSPGPGAYR